MNDDRRALGALLLVLQAGLALLAALGLLMYARLSNATVALIVPEAVAFGGPLVLLLLAVGIAKGWRVARVGIVACEALTLLGNAFAVLASGGANLGLTVALTGLALPGAILFMALRPNATSRDLRVGLTAGLLLLTGIIHLALVPDHWSAPPRLGIPFAVDGALFVVLGVASLRQRWWRWPAATLLVATILAYGLVVISRRELVDDLGIATKLVELAALGLVVWPNGLRLNWRLGAAVAGVLFAVVSSGTFAWAAVLRPGQAGQAHDGKVLVAAAPPTDAQRTAAATLVADTRAGIQRYADVRVALADGYRPSTPPRAPTVHYLNAAYQRDGLILDPTKPEALVYANTPSGPLLLGAMYMLPKANMGPPDIGGSLAEWHTHTNLCFTLPRFGIDGLESPYGTCPIGSINGPTPPMLHVWTVANPAGPFADLPPAYVARLTRGGAD